MSASASPPPVNRDPLASPILVTGGAGFIGSNFVLRWLARERAPIVNLDKLTYAGNPGNLASVAQDPRHAFVRGDICDQGLVLELLRRHRIGAIVHFAAESHVDRSLLGPEDFVQTNVVGAFRVLEAARAHWSELAGDAKAAFRVLHVSTDEVYGSLGPDDRPFSETSAYYPNSPYAASKAASDHFARAYFQSYGLPVVTTNCSNNFGPYQFPEKLIPLCIHQALRGEALPIYGDGRQVRDWLYVEDHCAAIGDVLARGRPGEVYNIGGGNERTNIDVVRALCALLDAERPRQDGKSYSEQIAFVADRPGHDRRYAIDAGKMASELGWRPRETFETGLKKTVRWYLDNAAWVGEVTSGDYRAWFDRCYAR